MAMPVNGDNSRSNSGIGVPLPRNTDTSSSVQVNDNASTGHNKQNGPIIVSLASIKLENDEDLNFPQFDLPRPSHRRKRNISKSSESSLASTGTLPVEYTILKEKEDSWDWNTDTENKKKGHDQDSLTSTKTKYVKDERYYFLIQMGNCNSMNTLFKHVPLLQILILTKVINDDLDQKLML